MHKWISFLLFWPAAIGAVFLPEHSGLPVEEILTQRYGTETLLVVKERAPFDLSLLEEGRVVSKSALNQLFYQIEQHFPAELITSYEERIAAFPGQNCVHAFVEKAKSLELPLRSSFLFHLYRALYYFQEIEGFSSGNFFERQTLFLEEMLTLFLHNRGISLAAFPSLENKPFVHFLFPAEGEDSFPQPPYYQTPKPSAVFKQMWGREGEEACWELSCLLQLDAGMAPCLHFLWEGGKGSLQPFVDSDLKKENQLIYSEGLYPWVNVRSYTETALLVLLCALSDIHHENMAYQLLDDATFHLRLFDTASSFHRLRFYSMWKEERLALLSPLTWIGWDYPQAREKLPKRERKHLANLGAKWKKILPSVRQYLEHPLTNCLYTKEEVEATVDRLTLLTRLISEEPQRPVGEWLEEVAPIYRDVRNTMQHYFPKEKLAYLLFQLHWRPEMIYSRLSVEEQKSLKRWIENLCS